MVVEIPLSQGYVALVDDEDAEQVKAYKWFAHVSGDGKRVYVKRKKRVNEGEGHILLHRWLTNAPSDMDVDHINRNTLDNRRSNLRLATSAQNAANRSPNSGRRFRGISFDPKYNKWCVQLRVNRRLRYFGRYESEEEAARVYDRAASEAFGEFAYLNFPQEG